MTAKTGSPVHPSDRARRMKHAGRSAIAAGVTILAAPAALLASGIAIVPGFPGGISSVPAAVSADGRYVTGYADSNGIGYAIRWSASGGIENLGLLSGGSFSNGAGISADGSVVVGYCSV